MKYLTLLLIGTCSVTNYAQSPRKVNKELQRSIVVAATRHDSLKTAFSTAVTDLENQRLALQNGKIREFDEARARYDRNWDRVKRISKRLGELGEKNVLTDYDKLYKISPIYSYPKMVKAAIPLFTDEFTFTTVKLRPITNETLLEEQNELLKEALKRYNHTDSINWNCLVRIVNCKRGLNELDAQLDSCIIDLQNRNKQFDETWNKLHVKYEELRAEYELSKNDKAVLSSLHKEFGLKNGTDFESVPIASPTFFQITQDEVKKRPEDEIIYEIVEFSAEFPDGREALLKYIQDNLELPEAVTSGKIGGKCYLKFIISAYGSVSNVKVQRGVQDCPECDNAAVDLVRGMPKWVPAMDNGKPVNSYYNLPITFKQQE